jgi:CheY-like chemotaxis protein
VENACTGLRETAEARAVPPVLDFRSMPEAGAGGVPRATILVVDDNDDVRTLTHTMLDGLGYDVVDVTNGVDALEILGRPEAAVDLLLTDVSMRPLGGVALAEQARALRPSLAVLFMSGEPATAGDGAFLAKPFTFAGLQAAVQRAIDPRVGSPPS